MKDAPLWSLSFAELQQMMEEQQTKIKELEARLKLAESNLEGLRFITAERSSSTKRSWHDGYY